MSESSEPTYPPPAPPSTSPPPTPSSHLGSRAGGSMVIRHVVSALVALGLTPIGLLVFDLGVARYWRLRFTLGDAGLEFPEIIVVAIGLVLLLLVAACGRISGLGPLVAGVVWGVLPGAWVYLDGSSFYDAVDVLPTVWDQRFWFGSSGPVLFPLVGTLLLGAAVAGRWRSR